MEASRWAILRNAVSKTQMQLRRTNLITCACLLIAMMGVSLSAQEAFETKHEMGMQANPAGVKVTLRTKGGQDTFHLFETIPITLEFASDSAGRYSIEVDEAMNSAGMANRFYLSDPDGADFTELQLFSGGVVCCDSDRRPLSQRPMKLQRELTEYIRFKKPGIYRVFYVTQRVFRGVGKQDGFQPSKLSMTSNELTLTILPDDSKWNSQQLETVLSKLRDPALRKQYLAATRRAKAIQARSELAADYAYKNIVAQTEYVLAQQALNVMDTPEAIDQRVAMMKMESETDLETSRKFGGGAILPQPLLASTTRPDLFLEALDKRAREPNFGIDYDYAYWWQRLMLQSEHPEFLRPFLEAKEREDETRRYFAYYREAEEKILERLKELVDTKTGKAKEITALTIKTQKANRDAK